MLARSGGELGMFSHVDDVFLRAATQSALEVEVDKLTLCALGEVVM